MLNKNQSNRKNIWKYSLILPMIVAFMLLFQIETVAQVRENENVTTSNNITSSSTKIESKITKNSTDKDLKELADALKATLDIQVEFEKIKRNKKKEITRIKVIGNIDKTYQSVIELDEDQGIQPFTVVAFKDHNNKKNITFVKEKEELQTTTSASVSTIKGKSAVIEYDGWKIIKEGADKNPVLFVVNETKQASGTNIQFDYNFEVVNSKELSGKEAEKKYGNVGKNGAYEFTVEKRDYANQLFIINGKEYTSNELKGKKVNLEGDIIKLSNEDGIARYGKKGRNGVSILNGSAVITDDGKKDVVYIKSYKESIENNSNQEIPEPPTPPTEALERTRKVSVSPKFQEDSRYPTNAKDEKITEKIEYQETIERKEMIQINEEKIKSIEEQERIVKKARVRAAEDQKAKEEAHKAAIKSKVEAEEAKIKAEIEKRKTEIEKRIAEEQKRLEEEQKKKAEELERIEQSKKE